MSGYTFIDNNGTFKAEGADNTSYVYFPVGGTSGMMGATTPEFGGDLKTSQNTFILEPVSSDNLHNNKSTRNFWINVTKEDGSCELLSAMGNSVVQHAAKATGKDADEVTLYGSLLSQKVVRKMMKGALTAEVSSFVPENTDIKIELTKVTIINNSDKAVKFTPVTAVPIYGRSADNIRDHRNVTSMLNRVNVTDFGIVNNPTLTFDERGHRKNQVVYGMFAIDEAGNKPVGFCPIAEDFIGEGGAFDMPSFPKTLAPMAKSGDRADGFEVMGAAAFEEKELAAGGQASYVIALIIDDIAKPAETEEELSADSKALEEKAVPVMKEFDKLLKEQAEYWIKKNNIRFRTGDKAFDNWMYWVGIQPMLRRIYGCSFLPHHDYGKGGRGWRDLWQDCLALIMMDPGDVRGMLVDNFGGVRPDGTNATIIGSGRGEFIADRNGITRVWMDHAMWPFMTMDLYIKQSGDLGILSEKAPYFIDRQVMRGESLLDSIPDVKCEGTVLEHLLLQNLAAFYDIGDHGSMKLRGADWNDALDMAKDKGESIAFTAAYSGNYMKLASILRKYAESNGDSVELIAELEGLMGIAGGQDTLKAYCEAVKEGFSGNKKTYSLEAIAKDLEEKANAIAEHIRKNEWFTDKNGFSRFNSYYDNSGNPLETNGAKNGDPAMMITGQVFTVMSGVATEEQVDEIIKSSDAYLYDEALGGYRLNTDFHEIKTDMGRMFGFSYGQKENGAVFCHMTTMYGNALYTRGRKEAGWKVIGSLYRHSTDFKNSKIYPGVPEYFDPKGRGVYHYLTGAASWLILTVLGEMFGVKGEYGDLKFVPGLVKSQFDENGEAGVSFEFDGKPIDVTYVMNGGCDEVASIEVDGVAVSEGTNILPKDKIGSNIKVYLK
ncbi:MAG: cellobiose phosphorylase [Saccharofermentans sp.]|nr:cellobiose phosphorylase [Saccharofermentans sp.]